MLTQKENDVWEVITGPGRRAKAGSRFVFGNGILKAEIVDVLENGNRLAKLHMRVTIYSTFLKRSEKCRYLIILPKS